LFYLVVDEQANVFTLIDQAAEQYDAVIDKGTLDSLLCGEASLQNVKKTLQGIFKYVRVIFDVNFISFLFFFFLIN
jgi:hypothetical protein